MNISVLIPCFNAEKFIENSYFRIQKKIKKLKLNCELIFIDDGSKDKTYKLIKDLKKKNKNIILLRNKFNIGKSFSLIKGIKKSKNKKIILCDCDLPYFEKFNKIIYGLKKYDLVLIDRYVQGSKLKSKKLNFYQSLRHIVSKIVNATLCLTICKNFRGDTQAGFKGFNKPNNFNKIKFISRKFFFDAELISLFSNSNKKILSIPINYDIAPQSKSSIKIFYISNFLFLLELFKIIINRILKEKLILS